MLTCIACPQHQRQDGDDVVTTTLNRKHSVKSITSHIKDMAIKASGAYKSCKPSSGSENESHNFANSDVNSVSERFNSGYRRAGRSNSMARVWGKQLNGRMKGLSSGEGTPVSLSGRTESVIFMEEDEPKEWIGQVEPGVFITFVSIPQGGNDLKRIRFSRELFNKWEAQRWWAENCERVMELYNVQRFSEQSMPLSGPPHSEDESSKIESSEGSPSTPPLKKNSLARNLVRPKGMMTGYSSDSCGLASTPKLSNTSPLKTDTSLADASVRSSSSREPDRSSGLSVSNASDVETEWVEQDQPGVYITIRLLPSGTRELRRVRFSRVKFGEMNARLWWEENKGRIQEQYL
ncbi:hypothetical protein V2J09_011194 [Rumex salicifolius]